jgi:hypothetical protein
MDSLKHATSQQQIPKCYSNQHAALERSLLGRFPPELILDVAGSLPPENAAYFFLCYRQLHNIAEAKSFRNLKTDAGAHLRPLVGLLANDLPQFIESKYCKILDAISAAAHHVRSSRTESKRKLPC